MTTHDQVNLKNLVRRLERTVSSKEWNRKLDNEPAALDDQWLKVQAILQKIKYARKLLKTVEADDLDPSPKAIQRYSGFRETLDRLQDYAETMDKTLAPAPWRPEPILPHLPLPTLIEDRKNAASSPLLSTDVIPGEPEEPPVSLPADDLLLTPSDTSPPPTSGAAHFDTDTTTSLGTLIPSAFSSTRPGLTPQAHTSALHTELSEQLAQMATQLRRNAEHFSAALAQDQAVVGAAQEKLEANYGVMKSERLRLRDLRGKSGGTTCLVVMVVVGVLAVFCSMFFIIRLT